MMEQKMTNGNDVSAIVRFFFLLSVPELIHSLSYHIPITKRFSRVPAVQWPAYNSMALPMTQKYGEYQVTDYDDGLSVVPNQEEPEYANYDKYPLVPVYGYLPSVERPEDREAYRYVDERSVGDPILNLQAEISEDDRRKEENYPYGQETWFERGTNDANTGFLEDLILAQMYQDRSSKYDEIARGINPHLEWDNKVVIPNSEEYEDDREWSYGVPVTEVEDDDVLRGEADDSVRELESLKEPMKPVKVADARADMNGPLRKDEIFHELQKQLNRNSRKKVVSVAEGLKLSKKQYLPPQGDSSEQSKNQGAGQGKSIHGKDINGRKYKPTTTQQPSTVKATERPPRRGQKEYVLPRPANPVRRPFDISIRSSEQSSAYNTIRKLLNMEETLKRGSGPRIQKRVVLSDDQLTSELSGLKKTSL